MKQKLKERNTYTPTNTSQVRGNCDSELNKEEILSVRGLKTSFNNPDENLVQHTERSIKAFVYVLSKRGDPLMPCSYAKSKRMVKKGAAKVIKRSLFTIQLGFNCENKVQKIVLREKLNADTTFGYITYQKILEQNLKALELGIKYQQNTIH